MDFPDPKTHNPGSMHAQWVYFLADGPRRRGPFTLEQVRGFPLAPETMVWRDGLPEWTPMRAVPELWAIFGERFVAPEVAATRLQPIDYAGGGPPKPRGMAITSFVLSLVAFPSWCLPGTGLLSIPLSIAAIVCGVIARNQVRKQEAEGAGLALSGIALGIVNLAIVLVVIGIVLFFLVNPPQPLTVPPAGPITTQPAP